MLYQIAEFSNGAKVMYDGAKMAKIVLPPSMKNQVCGVCGNFDDNFDNDRAIGYLSEGTDYRNGECESIRANGTFGETQVCFFL